MSSFFFPVTWIKPLHQNNHKNSKLSTFCYLIVKRGSTCVRSLNLKPVSSDSRCWTFPAKQTLFSEFDVWEEVTPRLPTNKVVLFKKKKEKEEDLLSFSTNERKKRTAWCVRAHGALTEDFLSLISYKTTRWTSWIIFASNISDQAGSTLKYSSLLTLQENLLKLTRHFSLQRVNEPTCWLKLSSRWRSAGSMWHLRMRMFWIWLHRLQNGVDAQPLY